jgi:hypothetical protein
VRIIKQRWLGFVVLVALLVLSAFAAYYHFVLQAPPMRAANSLFMVEPYLQLGNSGDAHQPLLMWAATENSADFKCEVELQSGKWTQSTSLLTHPVSLANVPAFWIYEAHLPRLPEGVAVPYRVAKAGAIAFSSTINPIKSVEQKYRVDIAGDLANGSSGSRMIARRLYDSHADLIVVPGDIVYQHGTTLEYLDHFFPVYNADTASDNGVPLIRSTLFAAAPGNHDTAVGSRWEATDFNVFPDGLGYFLWWHQPLNGPEILESHTDMPRPHGPEHNVLAFMQAAGKEFPREENFSLNFGNAHWVFVDSNYYVNWSHESLRKWLIKDLDSATTAWKFVVFHHPPFSSDTHHFEDQQMRVLADIFQDHGVDVVFAGHVHNYQRTHPLRFTLQKLANGNWRTQQGFVNGTFAIDSKYDGTKNKKPNGVLYIVTGGGGGVLTGKEIAAHPERWQPFTERFASIHSYTQCDFDGKRMHALQVAADGAILDEFSIEK